ncbi:MAG: nitroreductase [Pseudomonadota bacterium]
MPDPLDFFLTRRSTPVKFMGAPAPDDATLRRILTAATRVPDYGKLTPWKLCVLRGDAMARMARLAHEIGTRQARDPDKLPKQAAGFEDAPLCVAVLSTPDETATVPVEDQRMSAANVCLTLVNAAQAAGFGGSWLTSWMAHDAEFLDAAFGVAAPVRVAGFVHIGTPVRPVPERVRPDLDNVVAWIDT